MSPSFQLERKDKNRILQLMLMMAASKSLAPSLSLSHSSGGAAEGRSEEHGEEAQEGRRGHDLPQERHSQAPRDRYLAQAFS